MGELSVATTHEIGAAAALAEVDLGDFGRALHIPVLEAEGTASRVALAGLMARSQLRIEDDAVQLPGELMGLVDVIADATERIALVAQLSTGETSATQFLRGVNASAVIEASGGDVLTYGGLKPDVDLAAHVSEGLARLAATTDPAVAGIAVAQDQGSGAGAAFVVTRDDDGFLLTADAEEPVRLADSAELQARCRALLGG